MPYLKQFPHDVDKASAATDRLLQAIAREFSDVEVLEWQFSGPGKILLQSVPQEQHKTYGDLARSLMDQRSHLAPGQLAREISGTDSDSTPFRLSDYDGKAVLLTFSANWCAGCKTLYPIKRKLMEKFKGQPFVVLSVSRDEDIDTLKTSRDSGEITWRCWWDGRNGPIAESWHVDGAPAIFLLDPKHVILDTHLSSKSSLEDFEREIQAALRSES